jgi:uncharacterized protein (TIGR04255 family)
VFGFQNVKREKFKSSFLRKVFIDIDFPQVNDIKDKSEEIKTLFSDEFPRFNLGKDKGFQISIDNNNTDFRHLDENDNILLKSLDGQKEILLTSRSLKLSIEGKTYSSYEDSIQYLFCKFKSVYEIFGIEKILRSSIRKVNLIEFGYNDEKIPNGILDALLNKALVYNDDAFPDMGKINLNIHNVNFNDGNYVLNLKYGMNTLPNLDKDLGQLIIDLHIISNNVIGFYDLPKEITLLNDEIYNVFSWVINDDSKKIINNENFE